MRTQICLFDIEADHLDVLLDVEGHFEAPNWHKDGWLLLNGGGQLFRLPLDSPALVVQETGFAQSCNNDHAISPDGRRIAFTDKTESGRAAIYILSLEAGVPRRAVADEPSWLHGWSPDGKTLVYAAARGDRRVGIYLWDIEQARERCLSNDFDHADGPDFSADGQWVWFNGERNGRVDLWRVSRDGAQIQQMSQGGSVDWFAHPSPDGAHVVWLAFPPGTRGHPGNLPVSLWLMPQSGGAGRELTQLIGGQGTINVPSWSACGKCFAFARYAV